MLTAGDGLIAGVLILVGLRYVSHSADLVFDMPIKQARAFLLLFAVSLCASVLLVFRFLLR